MSDQSSGLASGQADSVSAWSLIRPYWASEERKTAWGLLIAIIVMDLILVGINARLNTWNRDFYNALEGMIGGTPVQIPGYMLWAAIVYAIAGSLLTNKVGHPLVSINYQLQRVEADFRFGLIRLRENAEQIAFYEGMRTEESTAQDLF